MNQHEITIFLWFSYGFPMVFQWESPFNAAKKEARGLLRSRQDGRGPGERGWTGTATGLRPSRPDEIPGEFMVNDGVK